jgi:hypothetical protein
VRELAYSAQRLTLPNLRQRANEDFGGAIDLSRTANSTWHTSGKNRDSPSQARGLRSAGFAFDQRLASSDQDWHSGSVAR